jgi:hypothetical protein
LIPFRAARRHNGNRSDQLACRETSAKDLPIGSGVILDFDAIDDRVLGEQKARFYTGYYRNHCSLPWFALYGQRVLVAYL